MRDDLNLGATWMGAEMTLALGRLLDHAHQTGLALAAHIEYAKTGQGDAQMSEEAVKRLASGLAALAPICQCLVHTPRARELVEACVKVLDSRDIFSACLLVDEGYRFGWDPAGVVGVVNDILAIAKREVDKHTSDRSRNASPVLCAEDDNLAQRAKFIELDVRPRYWEDTILNGEDDQDGLIQFRMGDSWLPTIDLETGKVLGWTEGSWARVHYKVCDDGDYWLLDEDRKRLAKLSGSYVPDDILCVGDTGWGDYLIFTIEPDGKIKGWKRPAIKPENWRLL